MKTRFKIIITISCFVVFYFSLIPAYGLCSNYEGDCNVLRSLITTTRLVVHSSQHIWDTGDGIQEWSGTVDGIEDSTSLNDTIRTNQNFILTMIVFPCGIIGTIVLWDKRK